MAQRGAVEAPGAHPGSSPVGGAALLARQLGPSEFRGQPIPALEPLPPRVGGRTYWIWVALTAVLGLLGIGATVFLALGGPEPRGRWGYVAAPLSFVISTFEAAPAVALMSRLARGYWAVSIRRLADVGAVTSVLGAALGIVLLAMLPDWRGRQSIWSNWPGAPQLWDGFAFVLLAVVGLALVAVESLPDSRATQDTAVRPARRFWRGAPTQWATLSFGVQQLGGLYLLVYAFVGLVVMSDLGLSLVPAWQSSVMTAYHVVSGFQGGIAIVTLAAAVLRLSRSHADLIGDDTFHALSKLLLAFALFWFYFTWCELLTYWYGRSPDELNLLALTMFGQVLPLFILSALLNFGLPLLILMWGGARRSPTVVTLVAVLMLAGLLLDRARLFVAAWSLAGPPKMHLDSVPPLFGAGLTEVLPLFGLPAAAACLYLLAFRFVPAVSWWEYLAIRRLRVTRQVVRVEAQVLGKPS